MGALKSPRCSKGHKLSGDNLYLRKDGQRQCKKCQIARSAASRRRPEEEAKAS